MARMARQLETCVLLAAALVWPAAPALAQTPSPAAPAPRRAAARMPQPRTAAATWQSEEVAAPTPDDDQPEILRSLPRPPEQPGSLFQEAVFGPPAQDLEHPYFERDPLLDPSDWAQPGWFADAEVGVIKPHVSFATATPVPAGAGVLTSAPVVQIGSAHFNWTAAPRLEIGYRLPSGFGEFSVSDRYFHAAGNDTITVPSGPASRHSSLMVNYTDLDYASRELTPWNNWSLKFRGGVRFAQTSFITTLAEPFAEAAAANSFFSQRQTNSASGAGPHFGLQLDRRFPRRGLTLVGQADIADLFMRTHQVSSGTLTTLTPAGGFDTGVANTTFIQQNPIMTFQLGLNYQPQRWRNSRLYFGYFGQFWYLFATNTRGVAEFPNSPVQPSHFDQQGMVFQWSWNH